MATRIRETSVALPKRTAGLWRCARLLLSYGRLRARPDSNREPLLLNVVPLAFATDFPNTGDKRSESSLSSAVEAEERGSNPPSHHVLPPAFTSKVKRPTNFIRDIFWHVVPNSIRPLLTQTAIASMAATQWSGSSLPAEKAAITSNTWSEKPPIFRMSFRSTAWVVAPG